MSSGDDLMDAKPSLLALTQCQMHGSIACSQGCAMCLGKSKLGMLGSSQESHKQTTRSLTGQLKASCRLLCTVASASGRTCLSGHRGETHVQPAK